MSPGAIPYNNRMSLDACVSPKNKINKNTTNISF
jgi:hypothetical protein